MEVSAVRALKPCVELPAGVVQLWYCEPPSIDDALLGRYERLLLPEERERRDRFVFERHRREYVVTRALVRTALARHRPMGPAAWSFRRDGLGHRPEIDPPCGLHFNLTNHPTMVVCAVREAGVVGVDVEPADRGAEILEVAETVFSEAERRDLASLPESERANRAVSLWTLKEAYLKARGAGLSLPLAKLSIVFDRDALAIDVHPDIEDGERWRFATVDLFGHRVAVAAPGERLELRSARLVPLVDDDA